MLPIEQSLETYRGILDDEVRLRATLQLIRRADTDHSAASTLFYILNDENISAIRLAIVAHFAEHPSPRALPALAKAMFDPDPTIRARAAVGIGSFNSKKELAPFLSSLLDAINDPATRTPAEVAVKLVTGKSADKVTTSERERVKLGESAESVWPHNFLPEEPPTPDHN
jgi:HEAT repeat protein